MASGRSRYQIHVPRRSEETQPASRSTLRWWLTVGWATSQHDVKSHAQTSVEPASSRTIARRVGSASAWRSRTSGSTIVTFGRGMAPSVSTKINIDNYRYMADHAARPIDRPKEDATSWNRTSPPG